MPVQGAGEVGLPIFRDAAKPPAAAGKAGRDGPSPALGPTPGKARQPLKPPLGGMCTALMGLSGVPCAVLQAGTRAAATCHACLCRMVSCSTWGVLPWLQGDLAVLLS